MAKQDFFNTKSGLLITAALALLAAYIFASLAIDSGSWWHYLGAAVSFIFALNRVAKVFRKK